MDFNDRLKEMMERRNITAYRLSKEAGITEALIGYWKKGKSQPTLENLVKLANYFEVSIDYLAGTVTYTLVPIRLKELREKKGLSQNQLDDEIRRALKGIMASDAQLESVVGKIPEMFTDLVPEMLSEEVREMINNYGVVALYESGKIEPSIVVSAALSRLLGTTHDYLIGLTDNPNEQKYINNSYYSKEELAILAWFKEIDSSGPDLVIPGDSGDLKGVRIAFSGGIGERIFEALNVAGKSRAQLARFLGTNESTISGWVKSGRVPLSDVILPICEFTGVSPVWLLSGEGEVSTSTVQEAALLGAFRALPAAGREVALKQVVALADAFHVADVVGDKKESLA